MITKSQLDTARNLAKVKVSILQKKNVLLRLNVIKVIPQYCTSVHKNHVIRQISLLAF